MTNRYQVCILGSGFAGSILAWILARHGVNVVVVDRIVHPRFAIGESSTPLADFLLRQIAEQWELPELDELSSWGQWRRKHPELRCGLKRGFSYFQHKAHTEFSDDPQHSHSYLVAASASDESSDTHWHRADVDAWLLKQARDAGAGVLEGCQVTSIEKTGNQWNLQLAPTNDRESQQPPTPRSLQCEFVVDASGPGGVLGSQLGLSRLDDSLLTRTGSIFGHFQNVSSMAEQLPSALRLDDPFPSDAAAQHHLLPDCSRDSNDQIGHQPQSGWIWMLRMQDDITSVGLTVPMGILHGLTRPAAGRYFDDVVARYPTVHKLLNQAHLIAPTGTSGMAQLGFVPRISRLWAAAAGDGWCMLPSTVGVIDPLHSTGIAHGLSGVYRAGQLLLMQFGDAGLGTSSSTASDLWKQYSQDVVREVHWIDEIVHLCYRALDISFDAFVSVSSLYFIAAVHSERNLISQLETGHSGSISDGFWLINNSQLRSIAAELGGQLSRVTADGDTEALTSWVRNAIAPWNDFGLLETGNQNRVHRSQTKA
ncbi:MAG TPA: hypothetical protein DDW52_08310 [Planctomycetaceae bacterium]|nr:hypothetical protein [Planctomycetaceae bacterium]